MKTRLQIPEDSVWGPTELVFLQVAAGAQDNPDWTPLAAQQEGDQVQAFTQMISLPGMVTYLVFWAPNHYTSLQVKGSEGLPELQFFDRILGGHSPSRASAQKVIDRLWPGKGRQLPGSCCLDRWCQKDSWSCGLQVLEFIERQVRKSLGQPPVPFQSPDQRIALGNSFLKKLHDYQVPDAPDSSKASSSKANSSKASSKASSSKPSKAEPATMDEALQRAKDCTKCHERKDGMKGCTQCMGQWFVLVRSKPDPQWNWSCVLSSSSYSSC